MASGIKEVSYVFAGRIALLVIGIGMQSFLAWFLSVEGMGEYSVCLLFAQLLSLICMVGCENAVLFYVASKKISLSEAISNVWVFVVIGSVLAIAIGLALMKTEYSFFLKASPLAFQLALVTIPISTSAEILLRLLESLRQFSWLAIASTTSAIFQFIIAGIYLWKFNLHVKGMLITLIINGLITIVGMMILYRLKYKIKLVLPSLDVLSKIWSYGIRFYFGKISNTANVQAGVIIVAFFATKAETGVFAFVTAMLTRAMIIPDVISNVLMPRVSQDEEGMPDLIAKLARLTGLVTISIFPILLIFIRPIISVLFSPDFLLAAPLFWVLTPGIILRCICKLFVPYFNGTNRPGISSLSTIFGLITNMIALLLLMPLLGTLGAAIAMSVGYLVSSIYLAICFKRLSKLSFLEIWRIRKPDYEIFARLINVIRGKFAFKRA